MLTLFTLILMGATTFTFWREGLLSSVTALINVTLAGLLAFNFFEPLANRLESGLSGSFLAGFEDCFLLVLLFAFCLGGLRLITNGLAKTELSYPPWLLQGGKVIVGLLTGYLVAGFLTCAFLTMPWPQHKIFGGLDVTADSAGFMPPDRVWLAMMHRAGKKPLSRTQRPPFDPHGNFELRYHRYRHYQGNPKNVKPHDNFLRAE